MTTPLRIDRIVAKRLRGATQETTVSLPSTPITLLFGENGTGKSTLIDAIDLVCCESFGSLADISPQLKSYLPTLGAKHTDVEAGISCGPQTWTARLKGKTAVTVTPAVGCPRVTVLRRTQVQRLITATPSERFNTLKDDIDVGGLDYAEDELRKAIKRAKSSIDSSAQNLTNYEARVKDLFQQEKRPDEQDFKPLDWLKTRSSVDISSARKEKESLKKVCDAYSATTALTTETKEGMQTVTRKRKEVENASKNLREIVAGNPEAARVLNEILSETLKYLSLEPQVEHCPVCGQPIVAGELRARIEEKLKSQPALQSRLKALQNAETAKKNEETLQKERYQKLVKGGSTLLGSLPGLPIPFVEEARVLVEGFPLLREWKPEAHYDMEATREQIAEAGRLAERFNETATKWNSRHSELESEIGAIETKKTLLKTYEQAFLEGKHWEKTHRKLEAAMPIVSDARKQYVQRVLDCLADDCDRIYQAIHPDEQLCGIRFMLDQEKKGSLDQLADFKGHKGVMPQTCFSDSHLDTLSFSFLLAMARQGDLAQKILVIDDILTSEDEQHLYRIGLLLADEARNFAQIIVATHLRKWLEWIRSGHLSQATYGVLELSSRWDLATGIEAQVPEMDQKEIENLLNAKFLDRTALAAKTRRLLEAFLGPIVLGLGAHAPMKRYGDYVLSDYLCGLASLAKDGWRVVRGETDPNVMRDSTIHDTYDIRTKTKQFNESKSVVNKLVHASEEGANYTDEEAREFAKEALLLRQYFACEHCGTVVGAKKKFMSCSCGEWKLDVRPGNQPVA